MKLVLGIESVGERRFIGGRQQITPDMRFTCDGLITSWIIGGDWNGNNTPFPELQVWRNIGNNTYQKIHRTITEFPVIRTSDIYVYTDFQPIPVLTGDILGIFLPRESRLSIFSENASSPTNYFLPVGDSEESTANITDLQIDSNGILVEAYHPLVSAVIGKFFHRLMFVDTSSFDTCSHEFKCSYTNIGKLTPIYWISSFTYLCSYSIRIYNYR